LKIGVCQNTTFLEKLIASCNLAYIDFITFSKAIKSKEEKGFVPMEVYLIVMNDCVVTKPMTDSIPMEKYYWSEIESVQE